MKSEDRRARAYAARALIEDPTLSEGWDTLEADIIAEWSKAQPWDDPRAKAYREQQWIELQVLRRLRQRLASFAAQGRE